MNDVVVITQGTLAAELVDAARNIVGDFSHITAVNLPWDATFEEDLTRVERVLETLDSAAGVLIVTDMFGGTPHNVAMNFHQPGKVEIVSGANLPMIVRLGCPGAHEFSVTELARWITQKARLSICTSSAKDRPAVKVEATDPSLLASTGVNDD
jgi:PTS system mannose-specific IIA component